VPRLKLSLKAQPKAQPKATSKVSDEVFLLTLLKGIKVSHLLGTLAAWLPLVLGLVGGAIRKSGSFVENRGCG
jgi:hypothetical protein